MVYPSRRKHEEDFSRSPEREPSTHFPNGDEENEENEEEDEENDKGDEHEEVDEENEEDEGDQSERVEAIGHVDQGT